MDAADLLELRWLLLGSFPGNALGGLTLNVGVAIAAFVASFLLGHLLAFGRLSPLRVLRWASIAYIETMRSVPLLIVLFWFYFSFPILLGASPAPLWSALFALTAYAAAYQAEFIRAGIAGVSAGEVEAARSLGLSRPAIWTRVVLAQAHRRMIPTYSSYFTSLFKDTSVLYIVGLIELLQAGLIVAEREPARMLEVYLTVASLFFAVCWLGSLLGRCLEHRLAVAGPASVATPSGVTSAGVTSVAATSSATASSVAASSVAAAAMAASSTAPLPGPVPTDPSPRIFQETRDAHA